MKFMMRICAKKYTEFFKAFFAKNEIHRSESVDG